MTAVRSIRAVIILNFSGLVFILLDGAKVGIFKVPENKSLSGFLEDDDGAGLETVFKFKLDTAEESSSGMFLIVWLEGLLAMSNFTASSGTFS